MNPPTNNLLDEAMITLHTAGLYRFYPLFIIQGSFNFANYKHDKRWQVYTLSVANSIMRTTNTDGDDLYNVYAFPVAKFH